jgi:hypothetical protein
MIANDEEKKENDEKKNKAPRCSSFIRISRDASRSHSILIIPTMCIQI